MYKKQRRFVLCALAILLALPGCQFGQSPEACFRSIQEAGDHGLGIDFQTIDVPQDYELSVRHLDQYWTIAETTSDLRKARFVLGESALYWSLTDKNGGVSFGTIRFLDSPIEDYRYFSGYARIPLTGFLFSDLSFHPYRAFPFGDDVPMSYEVQIGFKQRGLGSD